MNAVKLGPSISCWPKKILALLDGALKLACDAGHHPLFKGGQLPQPKIFFNAILPKEEHVEKYLQPISSDLACAHSTTPSSSFMASKTATVCISHGDSCRLDLHRSTVVNNYVPSTKSQYRDIAEMGEGTHTCAISVCFILLILLG